jgi:hypothetical protein
MLVAKICQNLANNVFFGKEVHMTALNDYLKENIVTVTRFMSELHVRSRVCSSPACFTELVYQKCIPYDDGEDGDEWLGTSFDEVDTVVLHRFFERHIDKVGKELLSLQKDRDSDPAAGNSLWNELCSALVELAQSGETITKAEATSDSSDDDNRAYFDLMDRLTYRSTEPVSNIFREIPIKQVRKSDAMYAPIISFAVPSRISRPCLCSR